MLKGLLVFRMFFSRFELGSSLEGDAQAGPGCVKNSRDVSRFEVFFAVPKLPGEEIANCAGAGRLPGPCNSRIQLQSRVLKVNHHFTRHFQAILQVFAC